MFRPPRFPSTQYLLENETASTILLTREQYSQSFHKGILAKNIVCRELIELEIQKEETKKDDEPVRGAAFLAQIDAEDNTVGKQAGLNENSNPAQLDIVEEDDEIHDDADMCHASFLHFFEIKTKSFLDEGGKNK